MKATILHYNILKIQTNSFKETGAMTILVTLVRKRSTRKCISLCSARAGKRKEFKRFRRYLRLRARVRVSVCAIFSAHMVRTSISYMHKVEFLELVYYWLSYGHFTEG